MEYIIQKTMLKRKLCIHENKYMFDETYILQIEKILNCKKCLSVVYIAYAILRNDDAAFNVM